MPCFCHMAEYNTHFTLEATTHTDCTSVISTDFISGFTSYLKLVLCHTQELESNILMKHYTKWLQKAPRIVDFSLNDWFYSGNMEISGGGGGDGGR